jgi:hypothetical protein
MIAFFDCADELFSFASKIENYARAIYMNSVSGYPSLSTIVRVTPTTTEQGTSSCV